MFEDHRHEQRHLVVLISLESKSELRIDLLNSKGDKLHGIKYF